MTSNAAVPPALQDLVRSLTPRIVRWRRHLHRHPELSHQELETARFVRSELERMGLAPRQLTPTSVVADVETGRPGPRIALRADIDALPVQEEADVPFRSVVPGVMHACGHDGHTAVLLGAAQLLSELRGELRGSVRVVFQHAEERVPSGAQELIDAGVLEGVDAIIGEHLWAPLATGKIAAISGAEMACADFFEIVVTGVGGHAAFPHTSVDPVAVGAQIVTNLQHLVARETDPLQTLVVSVTALRAASAANVIAERATLSGTLRALDEGVREAGREGLVRIAEHVAAAHRATVTVDYHRGPPVLVNDDDLACLVRGIATSAYGAQAVADIRPLAGADDFAAYQRVVPGVYVLVGAGDPARPAHPHHHPRFTIDDRALPIALRLLSETTVQLLLDG